MTTTLDEFLDALAAALVAGKELRDAEYVMSHTTDAHIMLHPRQAKLANAQDAYAAAAARLIAAWEADKLDRNKLAGNTTFHHSV